jgi:hypothetical protein
MIITVHYPWLHLLYTGAKRRSSCTVLIKSIRQSRVTGMLDVTNFATLSCVTQALDEYTFRHSRFKDFGSEVPGAIFLSRGHFPLNLWPFLASNLTNIVVQSKFNSKKCIFLHHLEIC